MISEKVRVHDPMASTSLRGLHSAIMVVEIYTQVSEKFQEIFWRDKPFRGP